LLSIADPVVPAASVQANRRQFVGLVGVPIDENRILYLNTICCCLQAEANKDLYPRHCNFQTVQESEGVVLAKCLVDLHAHKWYRFNAFKTKGG
jgi:hypothetical protein